MKRIIIFILFGMIVTLTGCVAAPERPLDIDSIDTYLDIPGITEEEISAIEEIKTKHESLSYGQLVETEAFILPDNTYAGFTVKFCELLSDLFDMDFILDLYDWDDLKSGLDAQRIDFTGDLTPTPERMRFYYMTHPIAERSMRIFQNKDAEEIIYETDINGRRIGFLKGSVDHQSVVKAYPTLDYMVVECESFADAAQKLKNHEIDGFITEGIIDPVFDEYDFIRSKLFMPLVFTPVSLTTANSEFAPIISVMDKYLVAGGIDTLFELYIQGEDEYAQYKLNKSFTDEEKAYINDLAARNGKVRVAFEQDNYPVSFYNQTDKEFQGIAIDVLKEIGRLTGIKFEIATNENTHWAEIHEKLKTGEVSLVSQLLYSDARKHDFIWSSVPYCSAHYALLSKSDYPDLASYQVVRSRVGTIIKTAFEDMYFEWFPSSSNTIGFNTQYDGLDGLESGEIDLLMASEYLLLTQLNYREKPGYKVNVLFSTPMDSLFGFNKDETVLRSIVDKAQSYVKTQTITNNWTSRVFDYSKKLTEQRNSFLMIFVALLLCIFALTVAFLAYNMKQRRNLEVIVGERTFELAQQTEAARAASHAKSDFLSRMSHEIRTPLNAVIGMVGIAMNTADIDKIRYCLERVSGASKHLLGVINDILDMSKIEAEKFELDRREFNFEKMLVNVTNVVNFRVEEKKQNFVVNLNGNIPSSIVGDDLRLSQVIANLLTNAVKFTPEGGTIILNLDKTEETNDEVTLKIEVEDNGIGISEEQKRRLFTSFEQADGSISRRFGGTGLGLVISKRIVELMGGEIWIESELGQGSKFIFTIKVGKGKEEQQTKLSEKINQADLRILAVDDSSEIREYFACLLPSLGLSCDVAASGPEALDMVKSSKDKPYNIFFIDWIMSEMDGVELTKRIKETAPDNSVVFMISAAEWSNIEKEALAAGVRSFISKPLFPSALVNAINECIDFEPKKPAVGIADSPDTKRVAFDGHAVLVAEDIEINREILSAILEDTGITIDYAENGLQAISRFQDHPDKYSLILMDIQMPEMDGYEATRKIRELKFSRAKNIPIIAMTANVFREDIDACLSAGMNDHIGKPIDQDDLFAKLGQYLT